ncbi:MAG: 3-oxoacyl-ACP synthase III family protein [Bacteroidales bacterium]|nr:3-oxoacyl-ACP synthase III family protein [Bacteroidales bacterium]
MKLVNTIITGTGSYIPAIVKKNIDFIEQEFYNEHQEKFNFPGETVIEKFKEITGIDERRYVKKDQNNSDIASIAAQRAVENADIDPETIDQIIMAHNYGDIKFGTIQSDMVPSLASRVKHNLGIKNPSCVAYDILFGCPGWIQGVIQAHAYIKAGIGKRFLVIGSETLSRVSDKYDRDSMIYADGAGATVIEAVESNERTGLLSISMRTDSNKETYYLFSGKSNNPNVTQNIKYIKMLGRKIYEYAITNVPLAMKLALDRSKYNIEDLKKIIIHQANEKMDEAMIQRFYRLYKKQNEIPEKIMPMSIYKLGNSSVATVPTLIDLLRKGDCEGHTVNRGDLLMFASVGAGMNINAFVYKY